MGLSTEDANAIVGLANRMGVDPGSLAGLMELESGIDANIWGGAGGKYRGLIQFGPGARSEVGLPDGQMSIAEQIPYVEKYFNQRGFKPGMSTEQMYRTVLVGNPHQSGTDSFGTNSDSAGSRMKPGGDLYKRGMAKLQGATLKPQTTGSPVGSTGSSNKGSGALSSPPMSTAQSVALGGLGTGGLLAALGMSGGSEKTGSDDGVLNPLQPLATPAGMDSDDALTSFGRMAGELGEAIFGVGTQTPVGDRMAGQQSVPVVSTGSGSGQFVTGNSGASTGPHLDFRVWDKKKGGYVSNPGAYAHLVTTEDGKTIEQAFKVTSPYGMRTHPTKGGRRLHAGIDYATPSGTRLNVAGKFVESKFDKGGGGNMSIYDIGDGKEAVLLHGA